MTEIGNKLKALRQRSKLSQFELELAINASPGSISRIEHNLVNPSKETLLKIATVLNLNFDEKVDLFDLKYSEPEKYIPSDFLQQELTTGTDLEDIINTNFFEYTFSKGKDLFIRECDSSLLVPSNEVYYIKNIQNWRKVYSENEANTHHVPKRMDLKKYAKFLINGCEEASHFKSEDNKYYRETRLIKNNSNFDYTLMIEKNSVTIFLADPVVAFTIKNDQVVNNARIVFNKMWEENKI